MNKQDLMLVLQNPELSKAILSVLSKDNQEPAFVPNQTLDVFMTQSLTGKPICPSVIDLREKGHRAASQFVDEYDFPVNEKFTVWFSGSESGLRNAFESRGMKPSISTLSKGKKYQVQILTKK